MQTLQRQRGWIGLLALVVVVMIVAWMARSVLKEYGLYYGTDDKAEVRRADPYKGLPVAPASADPTSATPAPDDPMARIRQIGNAVRDRAASEVDRR